MTWETEEKGSQKGRGGGAEAALNVGLPHGSRRKVKGHKSKCAAVKNPAGEPGLSDRGGAPDHVNKGAGRVPMPHARWLVGHTMRQSGVFGARNTECCVQWADPK